MSQVRTPEEAAQTAAEAERRKRVELAIRRGIDNARARAERLRHIVRRRGRR